MKRTYVVLALPLEPNYAPNEPMARASQLIHSLSSPHFSQIILIFNNGPNLDKDTLNLGMAQMQNFTMGRFLQELARCKSFAVSASGRMAF